VSHHNDFIVINKPVGVQMHDPQSGICQLLREQANLNELFLVHRLDQETSGCLVLAKTKQCASVLSKAFRDRKVTKYYLALSHNKPRKKQGKISGIMKNLRAGNYSLLKATQSHDALSPNMAITFFKSELSSERKRLFYLKPITGKTHQLRVALKSIGSPIMGDKRYKGEFSDSLYLHSYVLGFTYLEKEYFFTCLPETGEYFSPKLLSEITCPSKIDWPKFMMPE